MGQSSNKILGGGSTEIYRGLSQRYELYMINLLLTKILVIFKKHFHKINLNIPLTFTVAITLTIYLACGKIMNRPNYTLFWHLSCLLL